FAPARARDSSGFKQDYFAELARLEAGNFWFRARNRLIIWALCCYFPAASRFFEIGCGTGFVLSGIKQALPNMALWGSEISCVGLKFASSRLQGAMLLQMDARQIPFENEFDVIGAFDVLEHIEEDEAVLRQLHQALVPGGGVILTVPQHRFLWSRQDEYACHVRRYSRRELVAKVMRAGFLVEKAVSFMSLLLPLMMASRLRKSIPAADFDPLSELRFGRLTNAALERIMNLELLFIRLGLPMPAGGSLLVVAKKV
ncbi:MAG: methyltransferase domain-containing protein, partial [Candidatus Igneacidithiobacillus chanchocoensis]